MKLTAAQKRGALFLLGLVVLVTGLQLRAIYLRKQGDAPAITQDSSSAPTNPARLDVNTATAEDWEKLPGIGKVLSERIVKYRNSIGGFSSLEEIRNVYGLPPETFEKIQPLIELRTLAQGKPETNRQVNPGKGSISDNKSGQQEIQPGPQPDPAEIAPEKENKKQNYPRKPIDLNLADSVQLEALPGIGAYTAHNILVFRRGAGFFHSVDQLLTIRGVTQENFDKARPLLFVTNDLSAYPHLRINEVPFTELKKHPLVPYRAAQLIISYRDEHGKYKSLADCRKIYGIDVKVWDALEPYLIF